jgi:hypothetical protein
MSGGMGQPVNQKKFSDHFPTTITVTEADRVGSRNNSGGPVVLASHLSGGLDAVDGAGDKFS